MTTALKRGEAKPEKQRYRRLCTILLARFTNVRPVRYNGVHIQLKCLWNNYVRSVCILYQQLELDWVRVDRSPAFKTVFLGDSNVGKTCLARMFVDKEVLEQSCNTIGFDHHVRQMELEEGVYVKVCTCSGMLQCENLILHQ